MVDYVGGLLFLAGIATEDIKEKKVSIYKILIAGIVALIYQLLIGNYNLWIFLESFFPGIVLLLIALITKESIGFGDGMAVIVFGLWTGWLFTMQVVCIGFLAAGFYGLYCCIRKKKETIPFIPFLIIGMEAVLVYV